MISVTKIGNFDLRSLAVSRWIRKGLVPSFLNQLNLHDATLAWLAFAIVTSDGQSNLISLYMYAVVLSRVTSEQVPRKLLPSSWFIVYDLYYYALIIIKARSPQYSAPRN